MAQKIRPHQGAKGVWHYPLGSIEGITKVTTTGGVEGKRLPIDGINQATVAIYAEDGQGAEHWTVTRDGGVVTITPPADVMYALTVFVIVPPAFFLKFAEE